MSEMYTLEQARRILAAEECEKRGHLFDWVYEVNLAGQRFYDGTRIECHSCGAVFVKEQS